MVSVNALLFKKMNFSFLNISLFHDSLEQNDSFKSTVQYKTYEAFFKQQNKFIYQRFPQVFDVNLLHCYEKMCLVALGLPQYLYDFVQNVVMIKLFFLYLCRPINKRPIGHITHMNNNSCTILFRNFEIWNSFKI